jgi:hypothetical protein
MKIARNGMAVAASAALALLASAPAPASASPAYDTSKSTSGQASGPGATWSAASAIDGAGGFALDAAVNDPTTGAGATRALAGVGAGTTRQVTLTPGQYRITATLGDLVGTAEERDGTDTTVTAALEVQCVNCLTPRATTEILAGSVQPNQAVTPYGQRTLYGDTRTVTALITVVDRSGPVSLAVKIDASVVNGATAHRAGQGRVHLTGAVQSITITPVP